MKPAGHWRDFENIQTEILPIIGKLGRFPTATYLVENGYGGLESGIQKYHGGIYKTAERMGYEAEIKPNGFWKKKQNIINEARKIMKKHNREILPMQDELGRLGYSSFAVAVNKLEGGFNELRKILGEKPPRVVRGSWRDLDHTLNVAREFLESEKLTSLPSQARLKELGQGALADAISEYHKGFHNFRRLLGQNQLQLESGTWKKKKYILSEAYRLMEELGVDKLPSGNYLSEHGYSSFVIAVNKRYGGFSAFREILGEKDSKAPQGTWKKIEFIIDEARKMMKENDMKYLHCAEKIRELGYTSLSSAIEKYHGGYTKFRILLGESPRRIENGLWRDREYVIQQLEKIMTARKLNRAPTSYQLQRWGYKSLVGAVHIYHGGFKKFRESLGEPIPIKSVEQFKEAISKDKSLAMLSGASIMLGGESSNLEEVMIQLYPYRFKNREQLHEYITENRVNILNIVNNGLTNLGTFVGNFSLAERSIIPVLIGSGLSEIDAKKLSGTLRDKFVRSLQIVYSPRFNSNSKIVIEELESKVEDSLGAEKEVYEGLIKHYHEVIKLQEKIQ